MRIEITADTASELADKIKDFAALFSGASPSESTAPSSSVSSGSPAAETAESTAVRERGKPAPGSGRSRRTKEEIAEDEAAERHTAQPTASTAAEDVNNSNSETSTPSDEPAAAEPAEVEEIAAPAPEAEKLNPDEVKSYTISDYLNACFESQDERTAAFRSLVKEFGVTKFGDLKPEQLAPFKARVDALILERVTA